MSGVSSADAATYQPASKPALAGTAAPDGSLSTSSYSPHSTGSDRAAGPSAPISTVPLATRSVLRIGS